MRKKCWGFIRCKNSPNLCQDIRSQGKLEKSGTTSSWQSLIFYIVILLFPVSEELRSGFPAAPAATAVPVRDGSGAVPSVPAGWI